MCDHHLQPSKNCTDCNATYQALLKRVDITRKESIKLFELYKIHQKYYVSMYCKELDKYHECSKLDVDMINHSESAWYYTNYVSFAFSLLMKKTEEYYSLVNKVYIYEHHIVDNNYLSYLVWNRQDEYTDTNNVYITENNTKGSDTIDCNME